MNLTSEQLLHLLASNMASIYSTKSVCCLGHRLDLHAGCTCLSGA